MSQIKAAVIETLAAATELALRLDSQENYDERDKEVATAERCRSILARRYGEQHD